MNKASQRNLVSVFALIEDSTPYYHIPLLFSFEFMDLVNFFPSVRIVYKIVRLLYFPYNSDLEVKDYEFNPNVGDTCYRVPMNFHKLLNIETTNRSTAVCWDQLNFALRFSNEFFLLYGGFLMKPINKRFEPINKRRGSLRFYQCNTASKCLLSLFLCSSFYSHSLLYELFQRKIRNSSGKFE